MTESEKLLKIITEGSSDLIAILDTKGRRIYNSKSYETILGNPDKLVGTDSFQDIHPDDREEVRNKFFKTVKAGNGFSAGFRFLTASGKIHHIESMGNTIRDESGAVASVIVISRDVTEKIRAEEQIHSFNQNLEWLVHKRTQELQEANQTLQNEIRVRQQVETGLREAENRYHSLFENAGYPIMVHDLDGKILEANRSFYEWLDYSCSELSAKSLPHIETAESTESLAQRIHRICERGSSLFETTYFCRNGKTIAVEGNGVCVNFAGRPAIMSVLRDITEERRIQNELLETLESREHLDEIKNHLLETLERIANQFQAPLATVHADLKSLESAIPDHSGKKPLANIRNTIQQLSRLVEQIHLLDPTQKQVSPFQPRPINLPTIIEQIRDSMLRAHPEKRVILIDEKNLPPVCLADESLLALILRNLLTNALQYSDASSPIEITASAESGRLTIKVRDHGIGVPSADQKKLYQPFHRGANIGSAAGSGIGLSIVKRCVEIHGGQIECQSVEGKGTTFTVRIPLPPLS